MNSKKAHILLIEDNQVHVLLTRNAFKRTGTLDYKFTVIDNGYRAMQYFNTISDNSNAPYPDLILLDINMPRANGFEVLNFIKSSPFLKHIPVLILSGSSDFNDMMKCYQFHCSSFIQKPENPEDFKKMVAAIENFWFGVARLPTYEEEEESV